MFFYFLPWHFVDLLLVSSQCPNIDNIPTMYKDIDWTKFKGISGYKEWTRPQDDGNFTCAITWPGPGNDQQLGACSANRTTNDTCRYIFQSFLQHWTHITAGPRVWADTEELDADFIIGSVLVKKGCQFYACTARGFSLELGKWLVKFKRNHLNKLSFSVKHSMVQCTIQNGLVILQSVCVIWTL